MPTVTNASELSDAIGAAGPGEEILCAPGQYGDVAINDRSFGVPVRIASADPNNLAVFRSLIVTGCEGLTFDQLYVDCDDSNRSFRAVQVGTSSRIRFVGGLITGRGTNPSGMSLTGTDNSVEDTVFSDVDTGVVISGSGIKVLRNRFQNLRTTAIKGGSLAGALIEGNFYDGPRPQPGDHWDYIHIWTGTGFGATSDLTIRGNVAIQAADSDGLIGFFLEDDLAGHGFTNTIVESNLIYGGHGNGIFVQGTDGGRIQHNTLVQVRAPLDQDGWPTIAVKGCRNVAVDRNISAGLASGIGVAQPDGDTASENVTNTHYFQCSSGTTGANNIDVIFDGQTIGVDPAITDFTPATGGALDLGGGDYIGAVGFDGALPHYNAAPEEPEDMTDFLTITAARVISGPVTAAIVGTPGQPDHDIEITPTDPDYVGDAVVEYDAQDQEGHPAQTATLTVTFTGTPPTLQDDVIFVPRGAAPFLGMVLANDSAG